MLNHIDEYINNLEKKDRIINYLKNIYKIEMGSEPIIPEGYILYGKDINAEDLLLDNTNYKKFEEKVEALNLPTMQDKNLKIKLEKMKKDKNNKLTTYIDISNYYDKQISFPLLKRVFDGMKILKSVEILNISRNHLDDTYADIICELFMMESLKRIDLSHNEFSKFAAKKFYNVIKTTKHLHYLDLSFIPFSFDPYSVGNVISSMSGHASLYHFGISDWSKDSGIRMLIKHTTLRSLCLDDNNYRKTSFEMLNKYLNDKRCNLSILSLKFSNIDVISASIMEKCIRTLKNLSVLNLSSCSLSDLSASKIISSLDVNRSLVELNLSNNKLSQLSCDEISNVINKNMVIKIIDISKNILINNKTFQVVLSSLINNQSLLSFGDLSTTKIGIKLRESTEVILNLNQQFNNNEINKEFNLTQKTFVLNHSIDYHAKKDREINVIEDVQNSSKMDNPEDVTLKYQIDFNIDNDIYESII